MDDSSLLPETLRTRIITLEGMVYQLQADVHNVRTELRTEAAGRAQERKESDEALTQAWALAQSLTKKARTAEESEILLRTNLERLAASWPEPIATRLHEVLDSYKEIP